EIAGGDGLESRLLGAGQPGGLPRPPLHHSRSGLLGIWGLFPTVETLATHTALDRGVQKALISGLWVTSLFALRYPLKMVPILLFELVWKLIWLLAFGLPEWRSGVGS